MTSADTLKYRTAAAAERRLRGAVLEAAQDLLLADVAVAHQQKLEQVVVLLLLTRLRRAGLTRSHNIRLSQTLSILQATHGATKLALPLSRFLPCSRHADGSFSFTTATSTATSSGTPPVKAIASYRGAQERRVDTLMDHGRVVRGHPLYATGTRTPTTRTRIITKRNETATRAHSLSMRFPRCCCRCRAYPPPAPR